MSAIRVRRERDRKGGFTLLEVMISGVVMAVAVLAMARALHGGNRSARSERAHAAAFEVAEWVMAEIQAYPFDQVWPAFNADPGDDPALSGLAPGPVRLVSELGLEGLPLCMDRGLLEGGKVEVLFPTVTIDGQEVLCEQADRPELGCPRDLDGDGSVSWADQSTTHRLLPFEVRVSWSQDRSASRVRLFGVRANL